MDTDIEPPELNSAICYSVEWQRAPFMFEGSEISDIYKHIHFRWIDQMAHYARYFPHVHKIYIQ